MKKFLSIAAFLLVALSCQRSTVQSSEGCLCLRAAIGDASVKSGTGVSALQEGTVINIYNGDFSGLVRTYGYADVPDQIWLPCALYRADVIAGEAAKPQPEPACWGNRSYYGSENFCIEAGKCTCISITAAVSSISTIIGFSESLEENMKEGYSCTVEIAGNSLVYDAASSGREGCFIPVAEEENLVWKFSGTARNGKEIIKRGTVENVLPGRLYRMSLGYSVTDGGLTIDIAVDKSTSILDGTIVFDSGSSGMSGIPEKDIWARHVDVSATVDTGDSGENPRVSFSYSADGVEWSECPASAAGNDVYKATISGLEPETEYSCMILVNGEQKGEALKFTTAAAPQVPNGSFENTSESASGNYMEFYGAGEQHWWGSGNGSDGVTGSADFGSFIICKPDAAEKVDGTQSACLVSQWALVKFAAGNLFSGYFGGLVGTKGGKVYFGRPFNGRPSALKVWVKYSGGKIDRVDDTPAGVSVTQNQTYDTGRIQIALGNWDYRKYGGTKECPILVNTTEKSTFVDFATDKSTVAYGDLQLQADQTGTYNKWAEYTIDLNYSDIAAMPSYIVISCASSIYGDYFTGCSSSKMWIDKMELVYE